MLFEKNFGIFNCFRVSLEKLFHEQEYKLWGDRPLILHLLEVQNLNANNNKKKEHKPKPFILIFAYGF